MVSAMPDLRLRSQSLSVTTDRPIANYTGGRQEAQGWERLVESLGVEPATSVVASPTPNHFRRHATRRLLKLRNILLYSAVHRPQQTTQLKPNSITLSSSRPACEQVCDQLASWFASC